MPGPRCVPSVADVAADVRTAWQFHMLITVMLRSASHHVNELPHIFIKISSDSAWSMGRAG